MNKLKGETPGQGEEETDTETNTKPTGDMSAKHKASVSMKPSAASAKMEEYDIAEGTVIHFDADDADNHKNAKQFKSALAKSGLKHKIDSEGGHGHTTSVYVKHNDPKVHDFIKNWAGKHEDSYGMRVKQTKIVGESTVREVEAELQQLFGEEASAEFVTEASALFTAAVNDRVDAIMEELETEYSTRLDEELEAAQEAMVESVDKYLSYAINEWIEENKLVLENSLRAEIAEEFIDGLKNLFAEHYIEVPEEKTDVVSEMVSRIEELEQMVNEKTDEVIALNSEISEAKMAAIVESMTDGLAVTQAEKLKTLCEGLSFDDEETFAKKVQVIRENYFTSVENKPMKMLTEEGFDNSGEYAETVAPTGVMNKYVRAISRTTKLN
jgi:AcrR family transcriptional regulator